MIPDDEYFVQWQGTAKDMIHMLKASDFPKEQELGDLLFELTRCQNAEDLIQPLAREEPFALLEAIDYVKKALRFHSPEVEISQAQPPTGTLLYGVDMDEGEERPFLDSVETHAGAPQAERRLSPSNHAAVSQDEAVVRSQASLLDDVETYTTYDGESVDVRFSASVTG